MQTLSKPVKAVFFDLGWTLIYPPSGDWEFTQSAKELFHWDIYTTLDPDRCKAARQKADSYFPSRHKLSTLEEEYDQFLHYYTTVAQELPELGVTQQAIEVVTLEKVYQSQHTFQLLDTTKETLQALQGKYKLGIISDTWPSIVPVMEQFGLLPYFDTITYSFEAGCFKPDPRIFQDALNKMGLPAEQCVFVDDLPRNLLGAQKLGIQPVQIRANPNAEPCPEGIPSIDKTAGILELLK